MKKNLILLVVVLFSVFCLWLTFRGVEFSAFWEAISSKGSAWPWMALSGVAMWGNILFRGFRYHRILAAYPQVGLKPSITMTGIMFLGNCILPFRAGEAIRVFLPFKLFGIPLASSVALHGADRLFDMGSLLVLLALSLWFAGDTIAPGGRTEPFDFLGGTYTIDGVIELATRSSIAILVVGVAGVLAVSLVPRQLKAVIGALTRPLGERWSHRFMGLVDHIHQGVSVFRAPKDFVLSAFWTFMLWWMVIINVQLLCGVFGVDLSWGQAGIITIIVGGAVSIPQAPGYVGPFQLAFALGLSQCFGVNETDAVAIAWLTWFFQIFPVILIGFVCLFAEGLSLSSFSEAREQLEEMEEEIIEELEEEGTPP
jgi:uncharacterized membrane protein YbhN (UPF0104 family)